MLPANPAVASLPLPGLALDGSTLIELTLLIMEGWLGWLEMSLKAAEVGTSSDEDSAENGDDWVARRLRLDCSAV